MASGGFTLSGKQKRMLARITVSMVSLVLLHFIPVQGPARLILFLAVYLVIGNDILKKAWKGIVNGQVFNENFLMAVATLGAFALAIWEKSGDYNEAVAVMLFYQTGEFFQGYALGRSRQSISELMDIRPDYANIEVDGKIQATDPDEVPVGTIVTVLPGERIPIDGIVEEGSSTLDTSALTGESLPRESAPGDDVTSGCINLSGVLKIRTTKEFGESTVSRILDLVENSTSNKSRSENFISRFARVYTPAVCISALALAVLPPLVMTLLPGMTAQWSTWIYRALIFLVISCPCALVISIPLSFFAGIGGASRKGILVKGSNYLETLSKIDTVVFDKTGTLTKGVFQVVAVHHNTMAEHRLLEYAALAESSSNHPISISLRNAHGAEIDRSRVTGIKEISGHGITATVDGHSVAAGNDKLMEELGIAYHPCHMTGSIVHVAIDGEYAGHIIVSDVVKPTSAQTVSELKKIGIRQTVMLTGDSGRVAEEVGAATGIDQVYSRLLPADKVAKVEELCDKGYKVAFTGDGINDAPVLKRADIGIAMGALGSDAAIEAADVVLMDDDPLKIATAIRISRKCLGIVYQNIVFAITVKAGCLLLGALGLANMWLAIFADVGVMVLAVLNAMRCMTVRR